VVAGTHRTVIPFVDRGLRGQVSVTCEPDLQPSRWGYPLLGLPMDVEAASGFPVVHATVQTEGEGYASILGWLQVVRVREGEAGPEQSLVDVAPQLAGLEVPYLAFGSRPTLFDAPSTDARDDLDWSAHTYLVSTPDCVMTRRLVPLCGFGWGYQVRDATPITVVPTPIGPDAWSTDREVLARGHASWTFAPCSQ
jgi:hypothetical protein